MRTVATVLALLSLSIGPGLAYQEETASDHQIVFISETRDWLFAVGFWASVGLEYVQPGLATTTALFTCHDPVGCRRTIEVCEPVLLVRQTAKKTTIAAGYWKATTREDLRVKTFSDRLKCEVAAGVEPTGSIGLVFDPASLTIRTVAAGSPAAQAGIKAGYAVVKVDGAAIGSVAEAVRLLAGLPGTAVEVTVSRSRMETSFTLTRKPWSEVFAQRTTAPQPQEDSAHEGPY